MGYKILTFNPDGGAAYYIIHGYINAFIELGHEARMWDGNIKNWNNPDIYIGSSGWKQDIPSNHKNTKIVIHVNPWGKNKITPLSINESSKNIDWVIKQNPDIVFGYATGNLIDMYWSYWIEKAGIPVLGLPTAADSTLFNINSNIKQSYDIGFVGGRWNYKNKSISKWLDPILEKYKNHIIYGWGGWQNTKFNYRGSEINDISVVFNSSKICPAISEHTHEYGIDIPERIFKTALCNCVAITDKISYFEEYNIPDSVIPMANTPDEMMIIIEKLLDDSKIRKIISKEQHDVVLKYHTYIKRVQTLLDSI